jgi:homoserine dehydrogenase
MKPIRVGLLGLGVVGSGVWTVLAQNGSEIARRAGRNIEVVAVAVRDTAKARTLVGPQVRITNDGMALVRDPDIDIIVELIGGETLARTWILEAIAQGKHVVTANKALLAEYGNEIFAAAHERGVMVAFEAAVAGGIPIIKAIREGLTANRIQWLAGIINGTTNFILSEMRSRGLPFEQVLAEAQRLGYAEADPTFDIEGVDAAHKLTLLASLAFGIPVQFDKAHIEGISQLASEDIVHAERLGYRIKLLGITRRRAEGIELRVHPALIPADCILANVEGAMNAVLVNGDAVGPTLYYGQGAGSMPTASAVVADLVDVTRLQMADPDHRVPHLAFQPDAMADIPVLDMADVRTGYYLRMRVDDRPGVLADLARLLSHAGISIGSMFQQPHGEHQADIIFLTHEAREGDVDNALETIRGLPFIRSGVTRLRVEELN